MKRGMLLALGLAVGLAACDFGPGGPTTVTGRVEGHPALGAVVLEITWPGVTGFEGRGDTQAYAAPLSGQPNRHRVVLMAPDISALPFAIDVESPFGEMPVITILEAVNIGNLPVDPASLEVVLEL